MQYVTSVERIGIRKGTEKGMEIGLDKGRIQGELNGLLEGIQMTLDARFGSGSLKLLQKMNSYDADRLRDILKFTLSAQSLNEVRDFIKALHKQKS